MSNAVIFLDVDGVLNSETHSRLHGWGRATRKHESGRVKKAKLSLPSFHLINDLCRQVDAQVVISSSWRLSDHGEKLSYWRMLFSDLAELTNHKNAVDVIGLTPDLGDDFVRGDEVQAWLSDNPWVGRFVIIDDVHEFHPSQEPFFVQTDDAVGFTINDQVKALSLLKI